ncbi:DUF2087 domain-containing protein [Sphingoaurantiacus capsulatus]|uniref:DUF2087 domain-containing protein n=1 Tax=Sphingoaurantiacus capsulatus TaxID=1771310 RepID=A0ABV7X7C9_9SPHN
MPRDLIPFTALDMSAFAKALRAQLVQRETPPSHVEMLNMLARAAGHRNFQHLRAQAEVAPARPAEPPVDMAAVRRAANYFDDEGRLKSWPSRTSLQNLCLWAIWSKLPAEQLFDERGINARLNDLHRFGDHAILRRTMCELGLMSRTADGRDYRRIEQRPSPAGAALIRHLKGRCDA